MQAFAVYERKSDERTFRTLPNAMTKAELA
jgi:hypothetical protein